MTFSHRGLLYHPFLGSLELRDRSETADPLTHEHEPLDLYGLRPLAADRSSMRKIRQLMRSETGLPLNRRNDREVLAWFAGQLRSRRLHLVRKPIERTQHGAAASSSAPEVIYAEPESRSQPPPDRTPLESPPTFGNVDQDQQAEVLEAAARDGLPFCEECSRLAGQAAR